MSSGNQTGAVVGGVVGGVVGAYFGMPQLGFAVGWAAGGMIGGALDPPDDQLTDMGAQAFPDYNTALRGLTIPIIFGTCRVNSQIVWQGNTEVIRNTEETGGGGSGGGSQTISAVYTYKIGMVCHLGMSPVPMMLYGAWVNGTRLSSTSLLNIQGQYGDTFGSGSLFAVSSANTIDLTFDAAAFYPGNHPESDAWEPLQTALGRDIRWSGTAWVGFDGIHLGNSPTVPQLSWEVGPQQETEFTEDTDFIASSARAAATHTAVRGLGMDSYGNVWVRNGTNIECHVKADGSIVTYARNTLRDELITLFDAVPGVTSVIELDATTHFLDGTNCLVMVAEVIKNASLSLTTDLYGVWRADAAGVLTLTGFSMAKVGYQYWSNTNDFGSCLVPTGDDPEESTLLLGCMFGSSSHYRFIHLPSIAQMENIYHTQDVVWVGYTTNPYNSYTHLWGTTDIGMNPGGHTFFGLPTVDVTGLPQEFYLYAYLGKATVNQTTAIGASAPAWVTGTFNPARPNGGLMRVVFPGLFVYLPTLGTTPLHRYYTMETANSPFVAADGSTYDYFDDDGSYYLTGMLGDALGVEADQEYEPDAYVEKQSSGSYLVIFKMPVQEDPSYVGGSDWSAYYRMRAYLYNPVSESFRELAKFKGPVWSTADLGATPTSGMQNAIRSTYLAREGTRLRVAGLFYGSVTGTMAPGRVAWAYFGDLSSDASADLTPPEIIYNILVNQYFGLYPSADIVDSDSYNAALDYCEANNIYVSTAYKTDESAQRHIELLLACYNGYLVVDHAQSRIKFGVHDLSNSPVRTIDNARLIRRSPDALPVKTTLGARQDTFNLIRINYLDRNLEYKQNQVDEGDEVDQDLHGMRVREFPAQFVMSELLARKMAHRALWNNLYTRDTHQFYLGWRDMDLEPGDMITLVDSFSSLNQVVRITRWKEVERGTFEVNAVQQLLYITGVLPSAVNSETWAAINASGVYSSYTSQSSPSGISITWSPPPLDAAQAYEVPYEMNYAQLPHVYIGWTAAGEAAGASLYLSPDGTSFTRVSSVEPYQLAGRLLSSVGPGQGGPVEVVLFPTSAWSTSSPAYYRNATLPDVTLPQMHIGAGLFWVGSEMIAYNDVTLLGQNRYRLENVYRGWGGTVPSNHSSGDRFYHHNTGVIIRQFNTDHIGQTFYYKVVPIGFAGVEYNVASVTAQAYTITGRYYLPQLPPPIQYQDRRRITRVNAGGPADIAVTWKDAARYNGYGFGGAGGNPGGFGGFTPDANTVSWGVEVVGSGSVTVRSVSVSTPAYTYTASMNAADNGAWRGNVAFRVTPRNSYGAAPRTAVLSMELFF